MNRGNTPWGLYLRNGVARRSSHLGERLGWHWLTYNPFVMAMFHGIAVAQAPAVCAEVAATFPGRSRFLDVGAGSGAFAAEFARRGKHVLALEYSSHGRRIARRQGVGCCPLDLRRAPPAEIDGSYDLAYCFEVAEHLAPDLGDALVAFLASAAPVVIFTAAHPGQGGTGHVNEQPREYWLERFTRGGMTFDEAASGELAGRIRARKTAPCYYENMLVLRAGHRVSSAC